MSPLSIFSAEPCNTSPVGPDEDPLLCPYGYVCHVDESLNHKKRRKNSGQGYCIKQTNDLGKDNKNIRVVPVTRMILIHVVCAILGFFIHVD